MEIKTVLRPPPGPGGGLTEGGPSARSRRWAWWLSAAGLALIPWIGALWAQAPVSGPGARWSTAWIGLDALEAIGLFATGRLLARGNSRGSLGAAFTATLLLADAWFDLVTAASRADRMIAAAMALTLEIPLCVLCGVLAIRAFPTAPEAPQTPSSR